jgi:hypothetical protein
VAALTESGSYSLRCNSTGWNLEESSRFSPAESGLLELRFSVSEPYMTYAHAGDPCMVLRAPSPGSWENWEGFRLAAERVRAPFSDVPLVATGQAEQHSRIVYPRLGSYVARLDPAAGALSIHENDVEYRIRAYVDGRDRLVLRGAQAVWEHYDFAAVGRHLGADHPTLISSVSAGQPIMNEVAWTPAWPEPVPAEIRYRATSQPFAGLAPPLPRAQVRVTLESIQARWAARIVEEPGAANDFGLVLEFDDNPPGGADWYEVRVHVAALGGSLP